LVGTRRFAGSPARDLPRGAATPADK